MKKLLRAEGPSASEEPSHALFHHYHAVFNARGTRFLVEQLERFIDGFVREAKCAVVHGNHLARFKIKEGSHGVCWIGVNISELRRIVGPNGK